MPKGSKKRKASKKKAHHHHHHQDDAPHSSHNNGDDDMKHHDDKDSDGESQDNRNSQLDLSDGEKEERKKGDNRPNTSSSSDDSQSSDETTVQTEVVPLTIEVGGVDQELKPVDQSNVEPQNIDFFPNEERAYNDLEATDEVKEDKSTAIEVEFIKQSGDEYLEKSSPVEEETPLIGSNETVKSLPEGLHPVTSAIIVEETSDEFAQVDKVSLPDEKSNRDGILTVPETPGNRDKEVIFLEKNLDTAPVNSGSEKGVEKVLLSDANLSVSPLSEGKLKLSKNATTSDVMNNDEQNKDIEVSESSVRQPLLAAPPQPRTSWMNCCGLFEVFAGSGR